MMSSTSVSSPRKEEHASSLISSSGSKGNNHDNTRADGSTNDNNDSPYIVSRYEEMNPSRRCSMEDCAVYHSPGTWDCPDDDIAYFGIYDGHGGKCLADIVPEAVCHLQF